MGYSRDFSTTLFCPLILNTGGRSVSRWIFAWPCLVRNSQWICMLSFITDVISVLIAHPGHAPENRKQAKPGSQPLSPHSQVWHICWDNPVSCLCLGQDRRAGDHGKQRVRPFCFLWDHPKRAKEWTVLFIRISVLVKKKHTLAFDSRW